MEIFVFKLRETSKKKQPFSEFWTDNQDSSARKQEILNRNVCEKMEPTIRKLM